MSSRPSKLKLHDAINPKWADSDKTCIIVKASWSDENGPRKPSDFVARVNDCEEHGRDLFKRIVNGEFGTIEEYVPPSQEYRNEMKKKRNIRQIQYLMQKTSSTQVEDYDQDLKQEWRVFRSSLKSIAANLQQYETTNDYPALEWPSIPNDVLLSVSYDDNSFYSG